MKGVARADAGAPVEHHVGDERAVLAQHHFGADRAERADGAGGGNHRSGRDHGAGMNAHSAAASCATVGAAAAGWLSGACAVLRDDLAGQRGLAGQLAVHIGLGLHAAQAALERQHFHLDAQLVAGRHRAAELGPLDAGEDHQLLVAVGNLGHHDDAAGLGHGLHHQHAGHDGIAGKVALEKRLVDGHILDGHQALGGLELDDPVDQQKRVAVGKKTQDLLDVKGHSLAPESAIGALALRSSGL